MNNERLEKALKSITQMIEVINDDTLSTTGNNELSIWKELNKAEAAITAARVIIHQNK